MAEYYYDADNEVFKRMDNRGNYLAINISEALRIIGLIDLGYSNHSIKNKVVISNPNCRSTTIDSFIKNYKNGNINIPENAPAPTQLFESITNEDRISSLEKRVEKMEEMINNNIVISKNGENSLTDKVKSWMKR